MTQEKSSEQTAREFAEAIAKANPELHKEQQAQRARIVKRMRALAVKTITCEYSGYSDSGNIDNITFDPPQNKDEGTAEMRDFMFTIVAQHFPGYEINEGSEGNLVWDIATDKINIEHEQHYCETLTSTIKGL